MFILACGLTHVSDALMFWYPIYRFSAIVLFVTAMISWAAVIASYKVLPAALQLRSPAELKRIINERTEELAHTNAYLAKTNEELKETQKMLQVSIKQKDDLISMASHELKTPVTSLKMYAYMLANDKSHNSFENKMSMVGNINVQIDKMSVLINKMLDSSKLEYERLVYHPEGFKINELVKDLASQMQFITPSHKIIIEQPAEVFVCADKESINQVLENLITNAIKYSRKADKIVITIDKNETHAICSVQDFGIGIPPEHHDKIFERFYRVCYEKRNTYPGMGLGLYIVKDIIQRHKGEIWVESSKGAGSQFHFKIPLSFAE